jgi:hypothetical protein
MPFQVLTNKLKTLAKCPPLQSCVLLPPRPRVVLPLGHRLHLSTAVLLAAAQPSRYSPAEQRSVWLLPRLASRHPGGTAAGRTPFV